jgi:5-methylcytosine-specific restriction protein A
MKSKYTADEYLEAFRRLSIAPHHIKMLQAHYYSANRTMTATQMATAMGYRNHNAANLHYGKLGKLVGKQLGWNPTTEEAQGADAVYILAEFRKPGRYWLWVMRREVAQAIKKLGWTDGNQTTIPEEITDPARLYEGAIRSISVNAYERSAVAREKCILHYGCKCSVCDIILADVYGEIAQGHIHVHHLRQLSEINTKYQVDPIQDLRPVCPNCHAIVHMSNPPYTIEQVKAFIEEQKKRQCQQSHRADRD